jgi:16S rRNA C967 or C1407 C5-methylase (RsmB/RsmF family)
MADEDSDPMPLSVSSASNSLLPRVPLVYPYVLTSWLQSHGVTLSDCSPRFSSSLRRFIRFLSPPTSFSSVYSAFGPSVRPTVLPDVFSLPGDFPLRRHPHFSSVAGIDLASAIAVHALKPAANSKCLDICCAPGGKLSLIHDFVRSSVINSGLVVGLDLSIDRLNATRAILQRQGRTQSDIILCCGDGRKFSLGPEAIRRLVIQSSASERYSHRVSSSTAEADQTPNNPNQKRRGPIPILQFDDSNELKLVKSNRQIQAEKRRKRQLKKQLERKRAKAATAAEAQNENGENRVETERQNEESEEDDAEASDPIAGSDLYDRILVDAECSHDGSIRHLNKFLVPESEAESPAAVEQFRSKFPHYSNLPGLLDLQLSLLRRSFSLLSAGGILIYSTCSMIKAQNEGLVEKFLLEQPNAAILPVFTQQEQEQLGLQESKNPDTENAEAAERMEELYHQFLLKQERGEADASQAVPKPVLFYSRGFPLDSLSDSAVASRFASSAGSDRSPAWIRFGPRISGTSGLFIAKFTKIN